MSKKRRSLVAGEFDDPQSEIKRLALIAMFTDNELFEKLVLKGGNALGLVHGITTRASIDLDFSMELGFAPDQLDDVRQRMAHRLQQAFRPAGYAVFDIGLEEAPKEVTADLAGFWGGYTLEFKIIDAASLARFAHDMDAARRNAVPVGPLNRRKFEIQISKFEYCTGKQSVDFDGYTIYVYTPEMLVCEKLRAICQQMPEYTRRVHKHAAPRARDFLDIHDTISHFSIDVTSAANSELLRRIFAAKRVPLALLGQVSAQREFHRQDWPAVLESIRPGISLQSFDFYFDFVVELTQQLEPLRDI